MNILIVGGMTSGAKVAAKLRRELGNDANIKVICKSGYVSYAPWCLPHYLANKIVETQPIEEHTPESISALLDVQFIPLTEAISLDLSAKRITALHLPDDQIMEFPYDKLVIATGADYTIPNFIPTGVDGVYSLRNVSDADRMKKAIECGNVKRAVVYGGNKLGIEIACELKELGVRVSIIEKSLNLLPGFDTDYSEYIENELANFGIPVFTGDSIHSIDGNGKVEKICCEKRSFKTDMLVLANSLKPNTDWLNTSGLVLSEDGFLPVDGFFRTSDPNVYACGDCACIRNMITAEYVPNPGGSAATIEARFLAKCIAERSTREFKGTLETIVFHTPTFNAGMTGISYEKAKEYGIDAECTTIGTDDKDKRLKGNTPYNLRIIVNKNNRKIIGCEVIGKGNVDKMIDTAVALISMGATLDDVEDMDFAFAPEFSTPIQPFEIAVHTLQNKLDGKLFGNSYKYVELDDTWTILDSSRLQAIPQVRHIAVSTINGEIPGVPFDSKIALFCPGGRFSNVASNRLRRYGYKTVQSIEGGTMFNYKLVEDYSNNN